MFPDTSISFGGSVISTNLIIWYGVAPAVIPDQSHTYKTPPLYRNRGVFIQPITPLFIRIMSLEFT